MASPSTDVAATAARCLVGLLVGQKLLVATWSFFGGYLWGF